MSTWIAEATHSTFPWGTLAVNVLGSLVIGFFTGLTGPDGPLLVSPVGRAFVTIGILGGFTTFSSFSLQTMLLLQDGQWIVCRRVTFSPPLSFAFSQLPRE